MARRIHSFLSVAVLGAALVLGGCSRNSEDDLAELDNQLVANGTDPALNSALQDQILVDPTLSQQSNRNAVRPAQTPVQAQYPDGGSGLGSSGCVAGEFQYADSWANRLPAPFGVYPGGRVTEAAANNQNGCSVRVVTFLTGAQAGQLLDWYQQRAQNAGFSAERQTRGGDQILAGTNERSGTAYYLIVTPGNGSSEVALITSNGV